MDYWWNDTGTYPGTTSSTTDTTWSDVRGANLPDLCQMGEQRYGSTQSSLGRYIGGVGGGGSCHPTAALFRERVLVTIVQESGWTPKLVRTEEEKRKPLAPVGVRIPNRLCRNR